MPTFAPSQCDGTLAHGCVGAHAGAVVVSGPMAISTTAPLVCDAASGRCDTAHCPEHATPAPGGRYCSDLAGVCVGLYRRAVNAKSKVGVTRAACQAECDASPACGGYTYRAFDGLCYVHGPGLDTDLGGGWVASRHPTTTTIVSATGDSGTVCVAVVGRN